MNTPIADFVAAYAVSDTARLHMPGHKGQAFLGCEAYDITEVKGADALYEADGIIAESEANAAALFGSGRTVYSTEGSSQCIRAMLYLAMQARRPGTQPVILAARNVHKAFVYGAALLDLQVEWLWPEASDSLCGCPVSREMLEKRLAAMPEPPAAVYLTSPDYLGGLARIEELAEVCHRYGALLLVDNAHGAYLHFLETPVHPLDCGADLCCDSAHKTLPVLTGGAYLHISRQAPETMRQQAKAAMALFGSTSPSYLTLCSLDRCNAYLAGDYRHKLTALVAQLAAFKQNLRDHGWQVADSDPLRITVRAPETLTGEDLAERLRASGIECEHADDTYLVLMLTPENRQADLVRLEAALGENALPEKAGVAMPANGGEQVLTIRQALFAPQELVAAEESLGRICGTPTVSCPPAIPIAVSGERIGPEAVALFQRYGIGQVSVVKE